MQADFISHRLGLVRMADLLAYRNRRWPEPTVTVIAARYLSDLDDMPPPAAPAVPAVVGRV